MKVKRFLEKFIDKFVADDTLTLSASLAFYAALSLAPFLILFVTVSALMNEDLQRALVAQVSDLAGMDAAQTVELVVRSAKRQTHLTSIAGWSGLITLLISASFMFGQLRRSLNRIFSIHHPLSHMRGLAWEVWCFIKARLIDVAWAAIFLTMAVSSVLISSSFAARYYPEGGVVPTIENALFSATIYVLLFTLLFRYLPTQRLRWARAFQGGALTSILFVVGKELISYYLGSRALGSAYGAAGSLIVLLAWIYYSSLIIFVGAQVSALLNPRPKPQT